MKEEKMAEKLQLLHFLPLPPKPLFCSIAPQTPGSSIRRSERANLAKAGALAPPDEKLINASF